MNAEELQKRTRDFAANLIRFVKTLPQHGPVGEITQQLLDAGTSVAANYRASCRARSRAEFNAKMGVVAEEADETVFWLEVLQQGGIVKSSEVAGLLDEARQLRAIMAASVKTARRNYRAMTSDQQIRKSLKSTKSAKSAKSIKKSRDQEIKK